MAHGNAVCHPTLPTQTKHREDRKKPFMSTYRICSTLPLSLVPALRLAFVAAVGARYFLSEHLSEASTQCVGARNTNLIAPSIFRHIFPTLKIKKRITSANIAQIAQEESVFG